MADRMTVWFTRELDSHDAVALTQVIWDTLSRRVPVKGVFYGNHPDTQPTDARSPDYTNQLWMEGV